MKNTIILLLAKIFEKGIMFLFFILLAQTFGKEVFGEFSYFFTIATILFVIFDLGGEFYQIREFTISEKLKIFNSIFLIKTVVFIVVLSIVFIFYFNIYLFSLLCAYYLDSIISIFRSSLYKNGYYILESKFTIVEKVFFISIVLTNVLSIQDILLMYLAFVFSKLLYIFILLKKFYNIKYLLKLKKLFNYRFAQKYLTNSWSYVLHALLVVVFVQIDIVMLKQMNISYGEIGLYSAAVKIYMTIIIFADVLFKQYYPIVSKLVQNNENEKLKHFIFKIQNMNLYFSVYFSIVTMLFANEIITLAFGKEFFESSKMLSFLSIIIIFRFSMYTYTAILSSSNLNYIKLYTSLSCVIINIGLNYILIPLYGVYGAIIATIITEVLLVVLYKISSYKIIFTNYFTLLEFFIILLGSTFLYIIYYIELTITHKCLILSIVLISLIFNYKNIKQKLNFKEVINV